MSELKERREPCSNPECGASIIIPAWIAHKQLIPVEHTDAGHAYIDLRCTGYDWEHQHRTTFEVVYDLVDSTS